MFGDGERTQEGEGDGDEEVGLEGRREKLPLLGRERRFRESKG